MPLRFMFRLRSPRISSISPFVYFSRREDGRRIRSRGSGGRKIRSRGSSGRRICSHGSGGRRYSSPWEQWEEKFLPLGAVGGEIPPLGRNGRDEASPPPGGRTGGKFAPILPRAGAGGPPGPGGKNAPASFPNGSSSHPPPITTRECFIYNMCTARVAGRTGTYKVLCGCTDLRRKGNHRVPVFPKFCAA